MLSSLPMGGAGKAPRGPHPSPSSICWCWNGICQHKPAEQPGSFHSLGKGFPFEFGFFPASRILKSSNPPVFPLLDPSYCQPCTRFVHSCRTILRLLAGRVFTYPLQYYFLLVRKQQPAIPISSSCRPKKQPKVCIRSP